MCKLRIRVSKLRDLFVLNFQSSDVTDYERLEKTFNEIIAEYRRIDGWSDINFLLKVNIK
jgi:hypothetical protein